MAIQARHIRRGFAFIDVMIAIVIVGLAVAATMALFASGTGAHRTASQITVAMRLAKDVFEYAQTLPHTTESGSPVNDVTDLNGVTFGPGQTISKVVDATGNPMNGFDKWSQRVNVNDVDPVSLQDTTNTLLPHRPKRLIVTVLHNGKSVYVQRWLLAPVLAQ